MGPHTVAQRLFVIDDDLLSREILALLATEAGFSVDTFPSGESALDLLAAQPASCPLAILTDLQMPGLSGDELGLQLRAACGPETALILMSGTVVPVAKIQSYDSFLLKPFSIDDLCALLTRIEAPATLAQRRAPAPRASSGQIPALSQSTFDSLSETMPRVQLMALYTMCLDDADRRIRMMRDAVAGGDRDSFIRGAHSIKGGCGMVGALELAALATEMEAGAMPEDGDVAPFERLMDASTRLRRILDAQPKY